MIDFDEIIKKPVFSNLTEEQKSYYRQLIEQLDGKNSMDAIMIMMEFNKKAPKAKPLSAEEQELMIEAITESLPLKDKENFLRMIKIIRKTQ